MIEKIRPNAEPHFNDGNDGRDAYWCVNYTCPKCGVRIVRYIMACDQCGTFFDWSKIANVRVVPEIVWR